MTYNTITNYYNLMFTVKDTTRENSYDKPVINL